MEKYVSKHAVVIISHGTDNLENRYAIWQSQLAKNAELFIVENSGVNKSFKHPRIFYRKNEGYLKTFLSFVEELNLINSFEYIAISNSDINFCEYKLDSFMGEPPGIISPLFNEKLGVGYKYWSVPWPTVKSIVFDVQLKSIALFFLFAAIKRYLNYLVSAIQFKNDRVNEDLYCIQRVPHGSFMLLHSDIISVLIDSNSKVQLPFLYFEEVILYNLSVSLKKNILYTKDIKVEHVGSESISLKGFKFKYDCMKSSYSLNKTLIQNVLFK
jgi:hypothetical protein